MEDDGWIKQQLAELARYNRTKRGPGDKMVLWIILAGAVLGLGVLLVTR